MRKNCKKNNSIDKDNFPLIQQLYMKLGKNLKGIVPGQILCAYNYIYEERVLLFKLIKKNGFCEMLPQVETHMSRDVFRIKNKNSKTHNKTYKK